MIKEIIMYYSNQYKNFDLVFVILPKTRFLLPSTSAPKKKREELNKKIITHEIKERLNI